MPTGTVNCIFQRGDGFVVKHEAAHIRFQPLLPQTTVIALQVVRSSSTLSTGAWNCDSIVRNLMGYADTVAAPFWEKIAIYRAHVSIEFAGMSRSRRARVISCHVEGAVNDPTVYSSDETVAARLSIWPVISCCIKVKQCVLRPTERCVRSQRYSKKLHHLDERVSP